LGIFALLERHLSEFYPGPALLVPERGGGGGGRGRLGKSSASESLGRKIQGGREMFRRKEVALAENPQGGTVLIKGARERSERGNVNNDGA